MRERRGRGRWPAIRLVRRGNPVRISRFRERPEVDLLVRRYWRMWDLFGRYRRLQQTLNMQGDLYPISRNHAGDRWTVSQFLVNYPGSQDGIASLIAWLPTLHRLNEYAPVAVLVGDVTTYRAVLAATELPCYFCRSADETEFVTQQLNAKVMMYVNQMALNLREGGLHDMLHVFLGAGEERSIWLNNRLRLFDYVLVPDADSKDWMASRLMHYDADAHVRIIGHQESTSLRRREVHDQCPRVSRDTQELRIDTAVASLLAIRDERDELIEARDKELAERGIGLSRAGGA